MAFFSAGVNRGESKTKLITLSKDSKSARMVFTRAIRQIRFGHPYLFCLIVNRPSHILLGIHSIRLPHGKGEPTGQIVQISVGGMGFSRPKPSDLIAPNPSRGFQTTPLFKIEPAQVGVVNPIGRGQVVIAKVSENRQFGYFAALFWTIVTVAVDSSESFVSMIVYSKVSIPIKSLAGM